MTIIYGALALWLLINLGFLAVMLAVGPGDQRRKTERRIRLVA